MSHLNKGHELQAGQTMSPGDYLLSPNREFRLTFQPDANVVLEHLNNGARVLWASATTGKGATECVMQEDGNLVLYKNNRKDAIWATGTYISDKKGHFARLQDDGNFVVYKADGQTAAWATHTHLPGNALHVSQAHEQILYPGQSLRAANNKYQLALSQDNGLELTDLDTNKTIWQKKSTDHQAAYLKMQSDGNLVLYSAGGKSAIWATGTNGKGDKTWFRLEDWGDLVGYDEHGNILWSSINDLSEDWMSLLNDNLSLLDICIPGSHDAGMYNYALREAMNSVSGMELSKFVAGVTVMKIFENLAITQSLDLESQLKAGVRYFDLRPKYKENTFFVYHGPVLGLTVSETVCNVAAFVEAHPSETVILNWSHFEDFKDADLTFLNYLKSYFKDEVLYMKSNAPGADNNIWKKQLKDLRGKIIMCFDNNNMRDLAKAANPPMNWVQHLNDELPLYDEYSNTRSYEAMRDDQLKKFKEFNDQKKLFLFNWTNTCWDPQVVIDALNKLKEEYAAYKIADGAVSFFIFPFNVYNAVTGKSLSDIIAAYVPFILQESVRSMADKINPKVCGDFNALKTEAWGLNAHGKRVNILNLDFVQNAHPLAVCRYVSNH